MKNFNVQWISEDGKTSVRKMSGADMHAARGKFEADPPKTFKHLVSVTVQQGSTGHDLTETRHEFENYVRPYLSGDPSRNEIQYAWVTLLMELSREGKITEAQFETYKHLNADTEEPIEQIK